MNKFFACAKIFLLELFFPQFCINCGKEGFYLCQDCFSLIDFPENLYCPFCYPPRISLLGKTCNRCRKKGKKLKGLIFAAPYQNFIIRKIIGRFKYEPYVKDLAKILADLIIHQLKTVEKLPSLFKKHNRKLSPANFILVPLPLTKRKQRKRGFNQAQEIAKELSNFLKIPVANNVLLKIKETLPQVALSKEERIKNVKGAFFCKKSDKVKGKTIFLVDDVFTTGSTMEECARLLKEAGAKEIWGITAARE